MSSSSKCDGSLKTLPFRDENDVRNENDVRDENDIGVREPLKGGRTVVAMSRTRRILNMCLVLMISVFTMYVASYMVQYGVLLLFCLVLVIFGSLLYVHIEGAASRMVLWSLSRKDRQMYHAEHIPYFSLIPTNQFSSTTTHASSTTTNSSSTITNASSTTIPTAHQWNEWRWRALCKRTGNTLDKAILSNRPFLAEVDQVLVRSGWPTLDEVQRGGNTIVLTVRGLWAGLAARINPVLNAFLNRYVKCWNRSLIWMVVRQTAYGLPYPTVSVDFPTADVATLNFGQKDDCLVMDYLYAQMRERYPSAKIILQSVCLGSLRILNWLSRHPNPPQLAGVVLESPLPSVKHLLRGFLGSYFNDDLYNTFCLIVPNFRPELDDQYSFLRPLKRRDNDQSEVSRVPLLIGMISNDPFSNPTHLHHFHERFPNLFTYLTPSVHHENEEISHGKLYRLPAWRAVVQTFLRARVLASNK